MYSSMDEILDDASDEPPMVTHKEDVEDLELDQKQQQIPQVVLSERPAYTQSAFQEAFQYTDDQKDECCPTQFECMLRCSPRCAWNFVKARIPMLDWIQYYNFRSSIMSDVVAGATVGIMHIPQGMAYAMLGQVPPVLGLYVSFFPVLIYFFLGTSHHVSIGTFAIICLMLSKVVVKFENMEIEDSGGGPYNSVSTPANLTDNSSALLAGGNVSAAAVTSFPAAMHTITSIEVATAVCLVVGLIHIGMGIFRLGVLSMLLSETLVSGFTTGAAIHVFTSQVKHLFGLNVNISTPYFTIFYTFAAIFSDIHQSNYISVIISVVAITSLLLVNECINARFRGKMKMPIPTELIIIIIVTTVSYFIELKDKFDVKIVGSIPTGLPQPKVPSTWLLSQVILDCFAIAIVSFCVSLSMGMIFAKKHKYDVDPNQELFALGVCNVFSSFFSCFPCCVSLSRTLVQETAGGKTQVASLISCILVLVVVLFIGPLFESLPNCILASIIIVALKGMFLQFQDIKKAWKVSPLEGIVWLVSFLSVVITDVDVGLGIGIVFSLLTVILRTLNCKIFQIKFALPNTCLLGRIGTTDLYYSIDKYREAKEIPGLKIFHFGAPLYFANREFFKSSLYRFIGLNPRIVTVAMQKREVLKKKEQDSKLREVKKQRKEMEKQEHMESEGNAKIVNCSETLEPDNDVNDGSEKVTICNVPVTNGDLNTSHELPVSIHHIIIDCSAWNYIDASGISSLLQVIQEYQEIGITTYLAACQEPVLELLDKMTFRQQVPSCVIFPTIHDAALYACQGHSISFPNTSTESNF